MVEIREARFPDDVELVRTMFREYADGLGIDLCFQDFDAELAGLPGKYARPRGVVLLASIDGQTLGCVAMRPIDDEACEMKRLYVRAAGRGRRIGRALAERLCECARAAGYARMRLDTLPSMREAVGLYASLGFVPTAPYVYNPIEGALFMERALA
jgi:ribosomal protein S18 acetylase RimI-like enzyme